jgi:serine/threonine protein kinase
VQKAHLRGFHLAGAGAGDDGAAGVPPPQGGVSLPFLAIEACHFSLANRSKLKPILHRDIKPGNIFLDKEQVCL